MRVILYMAITANGYIAREDGETPWSEEESAAYYAFVKEKGNVVMGRKTYEIMKKAGEFEKCENPVVAVVTRGRHNDDNNNNDRKFIFVSSPREAVKALKKKGVKEIVVSGGSELNAGFLKDNLIDEMILDVEPFVFGKGIKLLKDVDTEAELELMKTNALSKNTIRLRYRVVK